MANHIKDDPELGFLHEDNPQLKEPVPMDSSGGDMNPWQRVADRVQAEHT